jgi:hypothetical protein
VRPRPHEWVIGVIIVRNKVTAICTTFTVISVISSVIGLAAGVTADWQGHSLMRLAICIIAIGSLYVFEWLEALPRALVQVIHFLGTLGLVFALVWVYGLFGELDPHGYRDVFFNYLAAYLGFSSFLWIRSRRARKAR